MINKSNILYIKISCKCCSTLKGKRSFLTHRPKTECSFHESKVLQERYDSNNSLKNVVLSKLSGNFIIIVLHLTDEFLTVAGCL